MVNAFSNGMTTVEPIAKAHKLMQKDNLITDFDISPSNDFMAVLFKDNTVCIYDFAHSRNFNG